MIDCIPISRLTGDFLINYRELISEGLKVELDGGILDFDYDGLIKQLNSFSDEVSELSYQNVEFKFNEVWYSICNGNTKWYWLTYAEHIDLLEDCDG